MTDLPPHLVHSFMNAAINLGWQNVGQTMPNPSVGALVVREVEGQWRVVGQGTTSPGGRPHAEVNAFAQAGELARGATLFVSLEPCAHFGKSPPCVDAVIAAGIATVYAACEDPNPHVFGQGLGKLRAAGITVHTPVLGDEAMWAHAGHVVRLCLKRPFVRLKLAFSKEGSLSSRNKQPVKLTNAISDAHVHRLRSLADGVLIGSETLLFDDPLLTVRLNGYARQQPARIIFDSNLRTPLNARVVKSAEDAKTIIFVSARTPADAVAQMQAQGVEVIPMPMTSHHHIDVKAALETLSVMGYSSILLEGGAILAQACLLENVVDEVVLISTPTSLEGGGERPGLQKALEKQMSAGGFETSDDYYLDQDVWTIWRRKDHLCLPA